MDEDNLDDSLSFTRFRSPTFTKEEILLLLDLIEKHKDDLLIKSMSSAVCRTKEIIWLKITKELNKLDPNRKRSTESIKIKWDNLKKIVRKLTNNLLDLESHELDEVNSRVLMLMCEAENKTKHLNHDSTLKCFDDQNSATQNETLVLEKTADLEDNCSYFDENDDNSDIFRSHRSPGFKKKEIDILISLVTKHQNIIMDKCTKSFANEAKEKVWALVCKQFNAQTDTHRKAIQLRTKWDHLKAVSKKYKDKMRSGHQEQDETLEKVYELIDSHENKDNTISTELQCNYDDMDINETDSGLPNELGFEDSLSEDTYDENDNDYETEMSGSRVRGRNFKTDETMLLLSLIEKHLDVIMNKCTKTETNKAKDKIWKLITEMFNQKTNDIQRNTFQLREKWIHVKNLAIQYRNKDPCDQIEKDVTLEKAVQMIDSFERKNKDSESTDIDNSSNAVLRECNEYNTKFSPRECALLLHCVKQENKLMKTPESQPHSLKRRAWIRITKSYNRLSPVKRPTKTLMKKFKSLKKLKKSIPYKRSITKLYKNHHRKKSELEEPIIKEEASENDDTDGADDSISMKDEQNYSNDLKEFDPLSAVLNTDSGLDEISQYEDKEVIRLKIELLNYKKETAKLERKRIENAIESDTLEASLRLRAARLEAVAAAMRLPPAHPALLYTPEEARAQEYILQYQDL